MVKEILYTTAVDNNGNLIHIDNAEKGKNYYCPVCKNEFILRKSGKIGKGSRRPHFAHNQLTTNCTPETVLHYSFKKMIIDLLEKYQSENKKLVMNWNCNICNNKHSENLLEKVASIREEYNLKECQPDIALLDEKEKVFAVIEIVVTHKPEEHVLQYYTNNSIVLIQINLTSEEDLKKVEEKITNPDVVDFCLNSKCPNYGNYMIKRELICITKNCNICFRLKKACYVKINHVFGIKDSSDFDENEIEFFRSKGFNFKMRINKKTKERYATFICLNCMRIRSRYRKSRIF